MIKDCYSSYELFLTNSKRTYKATTKMYADMGSPWRATFSIRKSPSYKT